MKDVLLLMLPVVMLMAEQFFSVLRSKAPGVCLLAEKPLWHLQGCLILLQWVTALMLHHPNLLKDSHEVFGG